MNEKSKQDICKFRKACNTHTISIRNLSLPVGGVTVSYCNLTAVLF